MTPTYSIIVPLYNKEKYIARTISSVLRQNVQDWELIVVDDGSTDGSAAIVKGYEDPRIKYFLKENGGVSKARNYGFERSEGEWIMYLDADDELTDDSLAIFDSLHKSYSKSQVLIGNTRWLHHGKEKTRRIQNSMHESTSPFFQIWMKKFNPHSGAACIRRSVIKEYGEFDARIRFFEDYEFGLRMMKCGRVAYTQMPVMVYYQEDGLSQSSHPKEAEMAYYIPEYINSASFWHKACLNENIEFELFWWQGHPEELRFYKDMQKRFFPRIFAALHWVRAKMLKYHWI